MPLHSGIEEYTLSQSEAKAWPLLRTPRDKYSDSKEYTLIIREQPGQVFPNTHTTEVLLGTM